MDQLEANIRARLRLKADDSIGLRWPKIARHYRARLGKGMTLAEATHLALANLSGSNRHDTIRGEQ